MSTAASKTDLTEISHNSSKCQVFSIEAHDLDALSTDRSELLVIEHRDSCQKDTDVTLIKQNSLPEEQCKQLSFYKKEDCDSENLTSVTQESESHICQDRLDDQNILSPESTSTSPRSESSQPVQLEGMEPLFGSKPFDQDDSPEFSSESFGDNQMSRFESTEYEIAIPGSRKTPEADLSSILDSGKESPSIPTVPLTYPELAQAFCEVKEPSLNAMFPSDVFQSDINNENSLEPFAPVSILELKTNSELETPEEPFTGLPEGSTTDLQLDNEEFEDELFTSANGVNENMSTSYSENQQLDFTEVSSFQTTQVEDVSSLSDVTPETVTDARHFSFEELMPKLSSEHNESYSDNERPKSNGEDSEDYLNVSPGCFASTVIPKQEMTLSTSEEECCIPPQYAETGLTTTISSYIPPKYIKVVHSGVESPLAECSDPEPYFDCKQAESDFSDIEPHESDPKVNRGGSVPLSQISNPIVHEKINQRVLLSPGSEDFEDAYVIHEPLYNVDEEEEELLHHTETSEDEFTLCEASQPPALCSKSDDTDKYLTRVR